MSDIFHEIQIPCGRIQGIKVHQNVTAYRGIRYAVAERWKYPEMISKWEGIYNATAYGPSAMQINAIFPEEERTPFYYHEFREGIPYTYSEDCLFLNVFAPDDVQNAPVVVYIHGGAFLGGSGWDKVFEEPVWPQKKVITVTINYRLGPFGFLRLPELEEESGHTGNYGLYDQFMALRWVHQNIEGFGGDKQNITLMGQSAGAISVYMLTSSPMVKGLVHRAVMSSGIGMQPKDIPDKRIVYQYWNEWKARIGCEKLEKLRGLPAADILRAFAGVLTKDYQEVMRMISPYYDSIIFPTPGKAEGLPEGWLDIPYLCGSNREDIGENIFEETHKWALERTGSCYVYYFCRSLPGDDKGAWHSSDLWYWFGALSRCWRPFTDKDWKLSECMVDHLMNFAKTGNPNDKGRMDWCSVKQGGAIKIFK